MFQSCHDLSKKSRFAGDVDVMCQRVFGIVPEGLQMQDMQVGNDGGRTSLSLYQVEGPHFLG